MLRISLILAIVLGVAVTVLNLDLIPNASVAGKINTIRKQREDEKSAKETAQRELAQTKSDLNKRTAELKQTQATLAATTEEKDKALADLAKKTQEADKLTADLAKTRKDLSDVSADLEAYRGAGLKPEEIVAFKKNYKNLEDSLAVSKQESMLLARKVDNLQTKLLRYESPDTPVYLPADLVGKVVAADPKWNFVVLNVGEDQRVKEFGELLVNRNGRLVAKVIVRSIMKDRCVANVMNGWSLGEIMEGDQVIPAHPQPPS
jgi:myosin heavy subunit